MNLCFYFFFFSSDRLAVANVYLPRSATMSGKIDGKIVFGGNLKDQVFLSLRRGGLMKAGSRIKTISFIPSRSPNPFRLSGVFPTLKKNGMYTLEISSYKAGLLSERPFLFKRKTFV